MMVFDECIADMRAFKLLEKLTGREHVLKLIEEGCEGELTFYNYPRNDEYIIALREKVNTEIIANIKK